jgi:hypothetical protein
MADDPKERPFMHRWRAAVFASDLSSSRKLTLLALAESAQQDGTQAFPGAALLAARTSQDEKTCRRALDSLDGSGWFTRKRRTGQSWRLWEYALTIPEGSGTGSDPSNESTGHSARSSDERTGLSVPKDRTLCPEGSGTVPDEQVQEQDIEQERATDAHRAPGARTVQQGKGKTFSEWIGSLPEGASMDDLLTDGDRYAEGVGLPVGEGVEVDFTLLAWEFFRLRHSPATEKDRAVLADAGSLARKRSTDWPGEYRKAIENAAGGLWAFNRADREPYLTTKGRQFAMACGLLTTKP